MHDHHSASTSDRQSHSVVGFRDLMVHLDNTAQDEVRIAHAEVIATMCEAHLTGIYTLETSSVPLLMAH